MTLTRLPPGLRPAVGTLSRIAGEGGTRCEAAGG
jgi:hypothetical protein